jgi:hypothetical protein
MTSGSQSHPPLVDDRPPLALSLKPKGSLAGYVDGGWWPGSLDLVVELPALTRALAVRLGRVTRVAFPIDAWISPPRQITVDGRTIRLEGFRHQDEYIVHVSGPDRRRISLLVIPQDATASAAREAMTTAAGRDNVNQPVDILAAAAIVPAVTRPRLRLLRDEHQDHWATDGGLVRERG